MAAKGQARPDLSYPIKTVEDYHNAVEDLNRPGSTEADRQFVAKRGKELGVSQESDMTSRGTSPYRRAAKTSLIKQGR